MFCTNTNDNIQKKDPLRAVKTLKKEGRPDCTVFK